MKIYLKENQLELLKENNTPDCVNYDGEYLSYNDYSAYPFGVYQNELIVGKNAITHYTMIQKHFFRHKEDIDEELLGNLNKTAENEGRIWIDNKVICFWDNMVKEKVSDVITQLEDYFDIDLSNGHIALPNEIVPISEFVNSSRYDDDNAKERIIHNLPPELKKKTPQMISAMNTSNKLKGEKFGEPINNRSVPEAEYNFYKRYGMGEEIDKVRQGIIPYESNEFTIGSKGNSPSVQYGVGENIDTEVNSNEVNLSSFKKEKKLNPQIWHNMTINPKLRLRLLDIADDFWDSLEVSWVKIKDIVITGSISNYNWSKYSDIDLHIIIDYKEVDKKIELVKDYFDSKKNEWNKDHENLKMYGFPVELYVQDINETHDSSGIYSIEKNTWLVKPNPNKIKELGLDKYTIKEKSAKIMTIIDDLENSYKTTKDKHVIDEIAQKVKLLLIKLKGMRKSSLDIEGESGVGNIIWKVLRRTSYLDKLYDLKIKTYDKINTLA